MPIRLLEASNKNNTIRRTLCPPKKKLLEIHTHKGGDFSTGKRVFYSLLKENDKDISKDPTIKFLGLLTEKLQEKGILSEEEVDDLLLESVYY